MEKSIEKVSKNEHWISIGMLILLIMLLMRMPNNFSIGGQNINNIHKFKDNINKSQINIDLIPVENKTLK